MQNKIYNLYETADLLRVTPSTMYRLVRRGQIQCFRVGNIYRFTEEQIQNFITTGGSIKPTVGGE